MAAALLRLASAGRLSRRFIAMARIKTTKTVRIALWALRIYLLILLGLIALKFIETAAAHH